MGKVILITGASSGFGKATAELLAQNGHTVYGISRNGVEHPSVHYLPADVRDRSRIETAVAEIVNREQRIDVLINNAGMGIGGAIELAGEEEVRTQMETNFMGCVNLCQTVLPYMRRQGSGKIINISSIGGLMGLPYQGFYSASKFAIEGLSEALSAEVKRFGIRVSIVEPGDFSTGFTANRKNSKATMEDPSYGPVFRQSLQLIEKEENGGLNPVKVARKVARIVDCRHPRLHYVVANPEQRLSVLLKRIVPGNVFVDILRGYYRT